MEYTAKIQGVLKVLFLNIKKLIFCIFNFFIAIDNIKFLFI